MAARDYSEVEFAARLAKYGIQFEQRNGVRFYRLPLPDGSGAHQVLVRTVVRQVGKRRRAHLAYLLQKLDRRARTQREVDRALDEALAAARVGEP